MTGESFCEIIVVYMGFRCSEGVKYGSKMGASENVEERKAIGLYICSYAIKVTVESTKDANNRFHTIFGICGNTELLQ